MNSRMAPTYSIGNALIIGRTHDASVVPFSDQATDFASVWRGTDSVIEVLAMTALHGDALSWGRAPALWATSPSRPCVGAHTYRLVPAGIAGKQGG